MKTRGRQNADEWVTSFRVTASQDGHFFHAVEEGKIYAGNWDRSTEATNYFGRIVKGKHLRIHPESWYGRISMRSAVIRMRKKERSVSRLKRAALMPREITLKEEEKEGRLLHLSFYNFSKLALQPSPNSTLALLCKAPNFHLELHNGKLSSENSSSPEGGGSSELNMHIPHLRRHVSSMFVDNSQGILQLGAIEGRLCLQERRSERLCLVENVHLVLHRIGEPKMEDLTRKYTLGSLPKAG